MARVLLWYGFLGGAGAWALQLVLGYGLEDAMCPQGESPTVWLVVATLVLGAVAAGSLGAAFVTWRRDSAGVVGFLAATGMLAAAFFVVLIALGGLQLLSLDSCRQG
jgi:hypothetical protein